MNFSNCQNNGECRRCPFAQPLSAEEQQIFFRNANPYLDRSRRAHSAYDTEPEMLSRIASIRYSRTRDRLVGMLGCGVADGPDHARRILSHVKVCPFAEVSKADIHEVQARIKKTYRRATHQITE